MRGKFSFPYVDIWFDVTKCKFIVKTSSFKMLVVFSPIFVADTKITFVYNFVASLRDHFNQEIWWRIPHQGISRLYTNGWTPEIREILKTRLEPENVVDRLAVTVGGKRSNSWTSKQKKFRSFWKTYILFPMCKP